MSALNTKYIILQFWPLLTIINHYKWLIWQQHEPLLATLNHSYITTIHIHKLETLWWTYTTTINHYESTMLPPLTTMNFLYQPYPSTSTAQAQPWTHHGTTGESRACRASPWHLQQVRASGEHSMNGGWVSGWFCAWISNYNPWLTNIII